MISSACGNPVNRKFPSPVKMPAVVDNIGVKNGNKPKSYTRPIRQL